MSRALAVVLALALLPQAPPERDSDPDLVAGIALEKEGDFEGAVPRLDAAVRRLEPSGRERELARAYLYLGVAYLELDQELTARGKFHQALAHDPEMQLDPRRFSPQVLRTFEATRQEMVSEVRAGASAGAPPSPKPSPKEKRRKGAAPFLVLGGAAAAGIVALAAGSSASPSPVPSANPTPRPSTTPTPAPTPVPTPTPAPTPTSCSFDMSPETRTIPAAGGSGTCAVRASRSDCSWSVESTESWIRISSGFSGTGSGTVRYTVAENKERERKGRIRLSERANVRCEIVQASGETFAALAVAWSSELAVPGANGRILLDGGSAYQREGPAWGWAAGGRGGHLVEATIVAGRGRPGLWRFRFSGGFAPGTIHVLRGEVASLTPNGVVFRVQGAPGEGVVFSFDDTR